MRNFTRLCFFAVLMALCWPAELTAQYLVSGNADPEANGVYLFSYMDEGKPVYSNGPFFFDYRGCTTKWAIVRNGEDHPIYSTQADGDVPPNTGWHIGGKYTGVVESVVMVAAMNSMAYHKAAIVESFADDGSFNDSILIMLNAIENPFTGENGDDFVADGKVNVSNLPEGLSISVIRKSDNMLTAYFTGTATAHQVADNVHNLTLAFQNSAFTDRDASEVGHATVSNLRVLFSEKYIVYDADLTPSVNDTFYLAGLFNNRPFYQQDDKDYIFIYKGCQYGSQWALTDYDGGCAYYSTFTGGETLPFTGWYEEGGGDGTDDTLYIMQPNSLHYSSAWMKEDTLSDGSLADSLLITFMARESGNVFTGNNGDDFIADGKVTLVNLPEGFTGTLIRTSDTTLVFRAEGKALVHGFNASVDNFGFAFANAAFTGNNAAAVGNTLVNNINLYFNPYVAVTGAQDSPEANGIFAFNGFYAGKPMYTKDQLIIAYRSCDAKWVLVDGDPDDCPLYSTAVDGDYPGVPGWSDGGQGGDGNDSIQVLFSNTLLAPETLFTESSADDGSLYDTLAVVLYTLFDENTFSGNNNDDFVADGKVSFNNVPEGLTPKALRANDTTVLLLLEGNAVSHVFNNNIHNLEVTFNESAFTSVAEQVFNPTITGFSILYQTAFEVMGGTEGNGTYLQAGIFNNKPYFVNGDYLLGYRGCDVQWVIVDGGDPLNLNRGYCPVYANEQETEWPPVSEWDDADLRVYQHNSLNYSKTTFSESDANDGSISNADTLVITCISPVLRATFSGEDGSDFISDDKITFSGMPAGLVASAIRTSDTTLAMVINGKTATGRDTPIALTFSDNAFEGITASAILYFSQELFLDFHNEFLVASSGGDFTSLQEAINSNKVKDGDILNLAAETFTENDLEVLKSLTIRGQGPGQTVVQAAETANSGAGLI
ncbi:MAG: hypothetical protein JXQ80_10365, partial [Bacteroidales bacterium]|nr:hypothetical protein [Bacteroidales bacterium]